MNWVCRRLGIQFGTSSRRAGRRRGRASPLGGLRAVPRSLRVVSGPPPQKPASASGVATGGERRRQEKAGRKRRRLTNG